MPQAKNLTRLKTSAALHRVGNMIACRDPENRGPPDLQSDALPTELSRLVTIPTHEPVIVAQRRAGKEMYDINAAGISQREQIASLPMREQTVLGSFA